MRKNEFCFQRQIAKSFLVVALLLGFVSCSTKKKTEKEQKTPEEILKSMTLTQKAQLVIGTGMDFILPDSIKAKMPVQKEDPDTAYSKMLKEIKHYTPGAAGRTAQFKQLGITSQVLSDGPAGLRIQPTRKGDSATYYCTAFPIATVLASSWDTTLVQNVGKAMGNEVLEYGVDVILGPGMNIQRDPLCGRNFEYYSEDPLVTGKMAAAMVKGIQSNGVGTSIKHFAANNQETNRMSANTIVSERALREIYLKGFEFAVKDAKPWTVMSSYNKINGVYTSESTDLLTKILRSDWGYKGYVMTDWGGGSDVVKQMEAGNDLIMPGQPKQFHEIIDAVNSGKLAESVLDRNVLRILRIMKKTPHNQHYQFSDQPDLKAHAEVTRKAATDGMVLLKNDESTLPLSASDKKIALFGNTSYDFISGGTGSGDVNEAYTVSLLDGLTNGGFIPNSDLTTIYEKYIKDERAKAPKPTNWITALMNGKVPVKEMDPQQSLVNQMASSSDIALITIGRNSGEGSDRKAVAGDFYLSKAETDLIRKVTKSFHAKHKKVVVILNIGGVIETASWKNLPDAILLAWQPGQEGGNSVTDILSGKVDPSGKLAVTFPVNYKDCPSSQTFPGHSVETNAAKDNTADMSGFSMMRRVPWETIYSEGIYVGYRYYLTFNVPVSYEFGYGLSYTSFDYQNFKLDNAVFDHSLSCSIDVKNTGKFAGKEVVQLYVSIPQGKLEQPKEKLVAFAKTRTLSPRDAQTIHFTIDRSDLESFNEESSSWIIESGKYQLMVGASSKDIKGQKTFTVSNQIVVKKVNKALSPKQDIVWLSQTKKN